MKKHRMHVSRTLKRTRDGKRVLIGISQPAIDLTQKLVAKYQKTYFNLWKKDVLTSYELELFNKIDRVMGKARKRERQVIGAWK